MYNRILNEGRKIKSASIFSRHNVYNMHLVSLRDKRLGCGRPFESGRGGWIWCIAACVSIPLMNLPRSNLIEFLCRNNQLVLRLQYMISIVYFTSESLCAWMFVILDVCCAKTYLVNSSEPVNN